ncbi:MAG: cell division topological specificity factor MinE [Anaerolinea sp.]|nr:cell division topological specificity factor MinE [Anaerolinea sp.]MCC6975507.1 cell division topological specificity factor MinE [Anaerolineae bacterium]CAG1011753.1 Cell division topological specificity factor [Anaerolineae bacterium]
MPIWDRLWGRRRTSSGSTAKERLQMVLVTDRTDLSPEKIEKMRDEITSVISKYFTVNPDEVKINVERRQRDSWLVADIPLLRSVNKTSESLDPDDA